MTRMLLVRHGDTDAVGRRLVGRMESVSLNERGFRQAAELAARLAALPIAAVYTSPLLRAQQTAEPLAHACHLVAQTRDALNEIDFGAYTGKSFAELQSDPAWQRYTQHRSTVRLEGAELAIEAQQRMLLELDAIRRRHPDDLVLVVSHGDPIRYALAFYLAMPIDAIHRLEILPASVSAVELGDLTPKLLAVNALASFETLVDRTG